MTVRIILKKTCMANALKQSLFQRFMNLLDAILLVSQKMEGICNQTLTWLTSKHDEEVGKLIKLFKNIIYDFPPSSCKQPCTKYVFETKFLYDTGWRWNDNTIKIVFSKKVELSNTSFLIGISSFLTGLGGAKSGGETLMGGWFY